MKFVRTSSQYGYRTDQAFASATLKVLRVIRSRKVHSMKLFSYGP